MFAKNLLVLYTHTKPVAQTTNSSALGARKDKMQTLKSLALLPATVIHVARLIIHFAAHTDEMLVLALRKLFPKESNARFPGFSRAKVEEWGSGQALELPSGSEAVAIGTLRDILDEHGRSDEEETCAAEIFAREIGILLTDEEIAKQPEENRAKYKAVQLMVEIVRGEDRGGAGDGDSIHNRLKLIHRMETPPSFQTITNWTLWAYVAEFHALKTQIEKEGGAEKKIITVGRAKANIIKHFCEKRAQTWLSLVEKAKKEAKAATDKALGIIVDDMRRREPKYGSVFFGEVKDGKRDLVMFAIDLGTPEFDGKFNYFFPTAFRRLPEERRPDIMIIRQPNGHVAIMSEKQDIDFVEEARALRIRQFGMLSGTNGTKFTVAKMSVKGEVLGWPKASPYLYLHVKTPANQLYCGSETAPSVPGLDIPFKTVCEIIRIIKSGEFHERYKKDCVRGRCGDVECPFYGLHMRRCLQVRRTPADTVLVR